MQNWAHTPDKELNRCECGRSISVKFREKYGDKACPGCHNKIGCTIAAVHGKGSDEDTACPIAWQNSL